MNSKTKGFTLIELLVVIGIVAILSAVVILTLNPAELLRQSRDSNRLSDMSTLKSAIALYQADVTNPVVTAATNLCYTSVVSSTLPVANQPLCGNGTINRFNNTTAIASTSGALAVDGSGWIPVRFTNISSGAPIGNLPKDPVNDASYYYAYTANFVSGVFELNTKMESVRYGDDTNTNNVEFTDGGNNNAVYEVGTAPGLSL